MSFRCRRLPPMAVAAALALGCVGQIGGVGQEPGAAEGSRSTTSGSRSTSGPAPAPGTPQGAASTGAGAAPGATNQPCVDPKGAVPMPTRIRRLTKLELGHSLADLLGAPAAAHAASIEADTRDTGFSTGDARRVTAGYADGLQRIAETAAAEFRKTVSAPRFAATCFTADAAGRACASELIRDFARRAYRRPIEDREVTALLAVYDGGRELGTVGDAADRFRAGLELIVRTILQSPHFIYRSERGDLTAPAGAVTQLAPFELAGAISFTVTASPPDESLFKAAEAGQLASADQIAAHVRRLATARPDRFKARLRELVTEWLQIDFDDPAWAKDPKAYPVFTSALKEAFRQEHGLALDAWAETAPLLDRLLTSSEGFASRVSAPIYGLTSTAAEPQKVAFDPVQRIGVLTSVSFLGTHARPEAGSPIARGIAIRKHLFCLEPPPVPAMVPPLPEPSKSGAKTNRERFVAHSTLPACAACHSQFDPMGYAFESYDSLGRFRTSENGAPIDPSGAIVATLRSDRPVANAGELARALGTSGEVHECFARQVFRYSLGRGEGEYDQCPLKGATSAFVGAKLDVRELLVAIARSRSFSTRTIPREP